MQKLTRKRNNRNGRRSNSERSTSATRNSSFIKQVGQGIKGLNPSLRACLPISGFIVLAWSYAAVAQTPAGEGPTTAELKVALDTLWVAVAAFLVIFMNAGFGMLETGMCRQKNAVNILSKNLIVFALATLAFWVIGFGIMFGDGTPFFGLNGFLLSGADNSPVTGDAYQGVFGSLNWAGVPLSAKFLFQLAFAGTAATIVSGAVAERIKFIDFLIFSLLLVGIAYPITGHWIWGGGWLADAGFWDFAGSTVVHSVGGWAALMGAAILGPRIGKYADGRTNAIPPHNLSIATLGCLILWLGWFGFNPGSTMAADATAIAHIALTTNLAAAAGGVTACFVAWGYLGKPDLSMIINGILAGLVGITAPCAWVNLPSAVIIGAIAGALVVFSVTLFDKIRIDDPVGAISVHLVCGFWGTLAVGLFAAGNDPNGIYTGGPEAGLLFGGGIAPLFTQLMGALAVGGMTVLLSTIFWYALKATLGIRVTKEEELEGLDIGEHGMEAYSGFAKEADTIGYGELGRPGVTTQGDMPPTAL
ncbi:MAG: ammonium transporter [Rivularia sp. (in: Bacteria)]|nr:ammonium transporter [Rivularia sp. MS3]